MKTNLATKNVHETLPEGAGDIACRYEQPATAERMLGRFFGELRITIGTSSNMEEWDFLASFIDRTIILLTKTVEATPGTLSLTILQDDLEDLNREFHARLYEMRDDGPEDSAPEEIISGSRRIVANTLTTPTEEEGPSEQELAELENYELEDDETLMAFLREELGKE